MEEMTEQELVKIVLELKEAGNNLKKRLVGLDRRLLEIVGRSVEDEPLLNEVVVWANVTRQLNTPAFVNKI